MCLQWSCDIPWPPYDMLLWGCWERDLYDLIDNVLVSLELTWRKYYTSTLASQVNVSLVLRLFQCTEERKGPVNNHTLAQICSILISFQKLQCDWSAIAPNFNVSIFYRTFKIQQTNHNEEQWHHSKVIPVNLLAFFPHQYWQQECSHRSMLGSS